MNERAETEGEPVTVYVRWGLVPWSFATESTVAVNTQVTEAAA